MPASALLAIRNALEHWILIALGLLATSAICRADGFLTKFGGQLVPEREQQAFLEWDGANERMFVAVRTAATSEPILWIIPVPGAPDGVTVEPIAFFRHVAVAKSAVEPARKKLVEFIEITLVFNSGFFPICLFGENANVVFSKVASDDVVVHKHVEKLGMVVEVLTAKTSEGLDRYLTEKKLGLAAKNLEGLSPYLNGDFSLICGWSAPEKPLEARALQIDFPTPVLFYPLRPSQVYKSDIETTIYVRGWAQPRGEPRLPGLRCRYQRGRITDRDLGEKMPRFPDELGANSRDEPLTRIELSPSPRDWTEDLYLVQGAPLPVRLAAQIEAHIFTNYFITSLGVSVPLAIFLPFVVLPRGERKARDWVWAIGVGAAVPFSIYAAAIPFYGWLLGHRQPISARAVTTASAAVFFFAFGSGMAGVLLEWELGVGPVIVGLLFLGPSAGMVAFLSRRALQLVGARFCWLAAYELAHLAGVASICLGLRYWMKPWA